VLVYFTVLSASSVVCQMMVADEEVVEEIVGPESIAGGLVSR
jgi:hypothetical protein